MPQPNANGQSSMNQKAANPSSGRQKGITMEVSLRFPMIFHRRFRHDGVSIHSEMTVTHRGFPVHPISFFGNSRPIFLSKFGALKCLRHEGIFVPLFARAFSVSFGLNYLAHIYIFHSRVRVDIFYAYYFFWFPNCNRPTTMTLRRISKGKQRYDLPMSSNIGVILMGKRRL